GGARQYRGVSKRGGAAIHEGGGRDADCRAEVSGSPSPFEARLRRAPQGDGESEEGKMITRRTFAAGTAAALAAPMLSRRARAAETWRHAILASKGDAAFFFMPKHKGFWEKRGLAVEIIELKGSKDVMRAVLAGEADSADPTPGDALPALEKGADVKFVGSSVEGYPYAMYVRPEINSWDELKDKTFGVSAPGSAPHMFALAMLETKKVPIDRIQIAATGGTTSRIKALVAGKLDATA